MTLHSTTQRCLRSLKGVLVSHFGQSATAFLASHDHCLRNAFCLFLSLPLQVRAADVQLPAGATFVVANSLTVSKKAETADRRWAGSQTSFAGVQAVSAGT